MSLAEAAVPVEASPSLGTRAFVRLLDAGFLIGTTTAVHELGHARQVRAAGGVSWWETGDVNWWNYFAHRDPLAAGATQWLVPFRTSLDRHIAILGGGFNATTSWDEASAGRGPLHLLTARYSTLFYELAGVSRGDDDLEQLRQLYQTKGYKISRREMQLWQLAAGLVTQLGGPVRAYTYFTPKGVSVRAVTALGDWTLAAETVVHGTSAVEGELGRVLRPCRGFTLVPKLLVYGRGVGAALNADLSYGRAVVSFSFQNAGSGSLLSWRTSNSLSLQIAMAL